MNDFAVSLAVYVMAFRARCGHSALVRKQGKPPVGGLVRSDATRIGLADDGLTINMQPVFSQVSPRQAIPPDGGQNRMSCTVWDSSGGLPMQFVVKIPKILREDLYTIQRSRFILERGWTRSRPGGRMTRWVGGHSSASWYSTPGKQVATVRCQV
jgi:hypothetical protein